MIISTTLHMWSKFTHIALDPQNKAIEQEGKLSIVSVPSGETEGERGTFLQDHIASECVFSPLSSVIFSS